MAMEDLQAQMDRIARVHTYCGGDGATLKSKKRGDAFVQLKSALLQAVGNLQQLCDLRERMDRRGRESSAKQIKVKNDIRKSVKALRRDGPALRKLYDAEVAKAHKKKSKLTAEQLSARASLVDGLEKQIREAISRATGREEETKGDAGFDTFDVETGEILDSSGAPILGGTDTRIATEEELTDEHRMALAQMHRNHEEQDKMIDEIGDVVGRLKNLGEAIGEELEVQTQQLDDLEKQVDDAQDHLDKINDRMKETLEMLNSKSDKFCMYAICLILLLGIATVVYNMVL